MKFRKLLNTVVILCVLNGASLLAGETLSLSPDQVIEMALEKNRDLQIAGLEIERAKSRARWSGRLANPEFGISGNDDFVGLDEGESQIQLAFSQKFPLTSRLKDEKTVRKVEVLLAETELAESRRTLAYEVHVIVVKLLTGEIEGQSHKRLIDLNKEIADSLQTRAEAGEASSLDVTQMRLNGRLLVRDDLIHDASMTKLLLALKEVLNLRPDQSIKITGELKLPGSMPTEKLNLDSVLQNRPDYLKTLVNEDRARAELLLQKALSWKDVNVRLFAISENSVDEPFGLDRNTFLGIGFSIPLPLRNSNQQGVELANININASDRKKQASKFAVENELVSALSARSAAWKVASEAFGEDVRLAGKNFRAFEKAYKNGQVAIIQVERAQEQLTELENIAVKLQREYHLADAFVRYVSGAYSELKIPSTNQAK